MTRIFFFCIAILTAINTNVYAQVYCRNETAKPVWLALVYNFVPPNIQMVSSGDTWISEGWYYIAPSETIQLSSHIGYDRNIGTKTNFFYYAEQEGGRMWFGARQYLIDNSAPKTPDQLSFRIEKAQGKHYYNEVAQLQLMPFKGATNTRESHYTIVLRQDDKNEGFIKHDKAWEEEFNNGRVPIIPFAEDQ